MKFDYWQDFYCGKIYHMYNKSVSGVDLFREKQEYNNFLNGFKKYFSPYTSILAYCLIPNHFHFLIKINEFDHNRLAKEKTKSARLFLEGKINENAFLQDQMRRFFSGVALKINNKYNRQGSIFLNRTKRVAINSKRDFEFKMCYVHHNPIHHGLCKSYDQWEYSSYNSFLHDDTPVASVYEVLELIGDGDVVAGKENFRLLHSEFIENFNHDEYVR